MSEITTDGRTLRAGRLRNSRREEILQAAQFLIAKRGYQGTSVADIIEAAGVSRGTFYLYFESYEALMHELLDQFIKKLIDNVRAVRIEDGSPMQQLSKNLEHVFGLLFDHPDLTRILLREAVAIDETVDQKLLQLHSFLLRMVQGALRNGIKFGFIRNVDENIVAMAIIGSIKEVVFQYLVSKNEPKPNRENIAKEILNFWLSGLTTENFSKLS